MALLLAVGLGYFIGKGGDKNTFIQKVKNNVNFESMSQVSLNSSLSTQISAISVQTQNITCHNCNFNGALIVSQSATTNLNVVNENKSQLTSDMLLTIQNNIKNQLAQAVDKTNTELGVLASAFAPTTQQQIDLDNNFNTSISANVTVDTYIDTQVAMHPNQNQTLDLSGTTFNKDVTFSQNIIIQCTLSQLLDASLDSFMDTQVVTDVSNQVSQTYKEKIYSPIAIAIIAIALVVVIGGGTAAFFAYKKAKRNKNNCLDSMGRAIKGCVSVSNGGKGASSKEFFKKPNF